MPKKDKIHIQGSFVLGDDFHKPIFGQALIEKSGNMLRVKIQMGGEVKEINRRLSPISLMGRSKVSWDLLWVLSESLEHKLLEAIVKDLKFTEEESKKKRGS